MKTIILILALLLISGCAEEKENETIRYVAVAKDVPDRITDINLLAVCPENYSFLPMEECAEYSPPFIPANQDENFITDYYLDNGAMCERSEDNFIYCSDCVKVITGWICWKDGEQVEN